MQYKQPVSEEQMKRLFYYTTRVKEFEYRPTRRFDTEESLHRLALLCRDRPIFPSLSRLYLERTWPVSLSVASLVFSPNIRFLFIERVRRNVQSWSKMNIQQQAHLCIQMLIRRCPSIRRLMLCFFDPAHRKEYDNLNIIFRAMRDLESIIFLLWHPESYGKTSIPEIQRCQWLQTISHLPSVRTLSFSLDHISDRQLSMTQLAEFRRLEYLRLQGHPSVMFEAVKCLKSPSLRKVTLISSKDFLTESDVYAYQRSISSLARHVNRTLTSLHLYKLKDIDPRDTPDPISLTALIQGLHPLYRLKTLTIALPNILVSDGDLIIIANSLPHLYNLEIGMGSSPGSVVTYHGLTELSAKCLSLEELYLPISIDPFTNLGDVTSNGNIKRKHPLKRFYPSRSYNGSLADEDEQVKIAQAIYTLFPNIVVHQCVQYGRQFWWNHILQVILLFQERDGLRHSPRENFEEEVRKALKWRVCTTED